MIPIRDNVPSRRFPFFTLGLIAANVALFMVELSQGEHLNDFLAQYGFVPAVFFHRLFSLNWNPAAFVLPAFSSMFLHGGWFHLIGNCWYLWIFGDNVEDRMGRLRFLAFYLLCGIAALSCQTLVAPSSTVPNIGASGAIAGVMGAYTFLYPRARVVVLIPIFIFIRFIEIPAWFFLGFWIVTQYLNSVASLAAVQAGQGGVAWWAHLGGFAAGAVFVWFFKKKERRWN